ncbi:hypothetical protein AMECASPLE_023223 [Ameca splendens]|uniref:Uncharacterized protein n=1 Tax=Ameca splendens TaxID=208324 RepID=A0ABV0XH79_9TELE
MSLKEGAMDAEQKQSRVRDRCVFRVFSTTATIPLGHMLKMLHRFLDNWTTKHTWKQFMKRTTAAWNGCI